MLNPISISTGVQFYRVRQQSARDLLNCDGEGWFSSVYSIAGIVCRDKTTRFVSDPKNMSNLIVVIHILFFLVCAQILDGHAAFGMAIATSFWTKNGRVLIPLGIKPTGSEKSSKEVHKSFASVNIFQKIKFYDIL